jgi:hypothetical protein
VTPPYLQTVVRILDRGLKSNSYKFALLRALADAGQNLKTNIIGFDWLGERFIEYYWPLSVNFRVRQATDPTRDPIIMRFIRREVAELELTSTTHLTDYKSKYRSRYEHLLSKCCSRGGCFDEVVPRFHNLRPGVVVPALLYESSSHNNLKLKEGALEFLSDYHRSLQLLAIGGWVRFTEQFTFAPRLYEKIAGIAPERKHEQYRVFLSAFQGDKCFYCGTADEGRLHIDHVIPWSFVLEDRVWNLVLACQSCNSRKRDRTPNEPAISKIMERNSKILDAIRGESGRAIFAGVRRDLQGFTNETLGTHFLSLARNCADEGFGTWSPS